MGERDVIYGYGLSYFTRKVEAACILKGVEYRLMPKTLLNRARLEKAGQTQLVPVMRTRRGDYLNDSTSILEYLDQRESSVALFPSGLLGIYVRLAEEWLDEWFPRVVLHYRWNHRASAKSAAPMLAGDVAPFLPPFLRGYVSRTISRWGQKAVRANGLDVPNVQAYVEDLCQRMCIQLDEQLACTAFAMGAAPTAVDAVLLGALRAHLIADPIPAASIEHGYPRLIEWAARRVPYRGPPSGDLPKTRTFIQWILDEMSGEYASYARKNRDAVRDGCRVIHLGMGGEKYTVLARRETEASRIKTSKMIRNIALEGGLDADQILGSVGLGDLF